MTQRIAELDRISRERALTPAESCELELELCRSETRPRSHGLTRAMARAGLRRSGRSIGT